MSFNRVQELDASPAVATVRDEAGADVEDPALEQVCLQELDLDVEYPAPFSDRKIPWSRKYSCRVHVERYSKSSQVEIGRAQREITAFLAIQDVSVPPMLDYFDPARTIYVILQDRDDLPLKQYIEKYGSFSEDLLKSVVTQLFNALAAIFLAGFAHLSIRDESLYIDADGQLTIKDFQHTHKYGTRKEDDIYATTDVRYGKDIWTAPEVLAAGKYNARKAVLWSCGIAIYYMTTGQIEKLTALEHPANPDSRRASVVAASPDPTTINSEDTSGAPPPISPRRPSFFSPRRKSSAANNDFQAHARRKSSISTGLPTISPIVPYPGSTRFDTPSWARDVISHLLHIDPQRRSELIEVATKVPKETAGKGLRPLVETCYLDYKEHVGPYASLNLNFDDNASTTGSMYSGMSRLSRPLSNLLGRRTSTSAAKDYRRYA